MTDVGKKLLEESVVVGVTVKTSELEAAEVDTGAGGVVTVPLEGGAGEEEVEIGGDGVVVSVGVVTGGVVISVTDTLVGELGGVVTVPFEVITMVPDVVGDVGGGGGGSVGEITVVGGEVGVTTTVSGVLVGALVGVDRMEPMTLVSDDNKLERRLPSPTLVVVAAAEESGV